MGTQGVARVAVRASGHACIHEWFLQTAARLPDHVAIEHGPTRLRYAELRARALAVAAALQAAGVRKGEPVGLFLNDRPTTIAAMIGTLAAGGAFVPIAPELPDNRIAKMLEACPLRLVVAEDAAWERIAAIAARAGCAPALVSPCATDVNPGLVRLAAWQPDDLCYVFFTSGSTGTPKAIAGRLKAIAHYVDWQITALGIEHPVRGSQLITPSFDAIIREVFVPLCAGGTVCIPDDPITRLDGAQLVRWFESSRVELAFCVPSVLRMLLREVDPDRPPASLRYILAAGEPLLPSDVQLWARTLGRRVRLLNLYGPSETTLTKFAYEVSPSDEGRRSIPIGKPVPGAAALVVDEHDAPCPQGIPGEILIRTPFRTLGYLGRPDLTAQVFVPNPLRRDPDDIVYRTGDIGRVLEDGNFEFLGRRDHQLKVRGVRVETTEIESIARATGVVRDIVVTGRTRDDQVSLAAYVVPAGGRTVGEIREQMSRELPDYLMPSVWVTLDALPRTPNGKVDRQALPEPDGWSDPPRTPIEEILCGLWASLLNGAPVGRDANFFEIGGHSLLATRMLTRVRSCFRVEVPLRVFLEGPTIAALAAYVAAACSRDTAEPPLLRRVARDAPQPLSYGQRRLWTVQQMAPSSVAYNVPLAIRMRGDLNGGAALRALQTIVSRHEILRTAFGVDEQGEPFQRVRADHRLPVATIDLSALPFALAEPIAESAVRDDAAVPFDLLDGPPLRARLLRIAGDDHVLLVTMHHIMCDGWSNGLLMREFSTLYASFARAETPLLPAVPFQYTDFACWQREWFSTGRLERQMTYWRDQLKDVRPLELPVAARGGSQGTARRGGKALLSMDPALYEELRAFSRQEGATLFMTLLAAWQILMSRYSQQRDIAIGCPIANRPLPELESMFGFFANTIVLRSRIDPSTSFRDVVHGVRNTVLDAHANQDVPFETLVEELAPKRDLARHPLFQVLFAFFSGVAPEFELPGLRVSRVGAASHAPKFELFLALNEGPNGIRGGLEYDEAIFDPASAGLLVERYLTLLRNLCRDAASPVERASLMTAEERDLVLYRWNDTSSPPPSSGGGAPSFVHELVQAQAGRTPNAVAIIDRDESVTYAELMDRADALAARLRARGVGPDVLVAVGMDRTANLVVALLAVLEAGGAYVPIDPEYPAIRRDYILQDAKAALLLTDGAVTSEHTPVLRLDGAASPVRAEDDAAPLAVPIASGLHPANPAYVLYTSGSTGRPKGVVVTQLGLANFLHAMRRQPGLTSSDVVLAVTTLAFDIASFELLFPLTVGARLLLARSRDLADGRALTAAMVRHGVTVVQTTPSTYRLLLESGWTGHSGLTMLTIGETLTRDLADALLARGGRLWNGYGPTETTVYSTIAPVGAGESIVVGRPLANTQCYVLDGAGEPVPPGLDGELCIGGFGLARAYHRQPALTAERFVPDPFSQAPGARMYRTGDRVRYQPSGDLEFVGRWDLQVKLRGFRIELGEIEAVLSTHPAIAESVVVAHDDESGDPRLVAYVVASQGGQLDAGTLRSFVRERLPEYMVPALFEFLNHLPRTPGGKIDRHALPALRPHEGTTRHHVAPRDNIEVHLAQMWEDLLGIQGIGVQDDFFLAGGHSLKAVRLATLLGAAYDMHVPPHVIFAERTIEQQASYVRHKGRVSPPSSVVPMRTRGTLPPLYCVHPLGGLVHVFVDLVRLLGPDQPFYGLQAVGFEPDVEPLIDVRDMARRYVRDIKRVQPMGPYRLAGWSMGVPIVFEMARQMTASGDTISKLLLLNGGLHEAVSYDAGQRAARIAALEDSFLTGISVDMAVEVDEDFGRLPFDERVDFYLTNGKRLGTVPPDLEAGHMRRLVHVMACNQVAAESYQPGVYGGAVTLIHATVSPGEDPLVGVGRYVTGPIDVGEVPGTHNDLLHPPWVQGLAESLRAALARADDPAGLDALSLDQTNVSL